MEYKAPKLPQPVAEIHSKRLRWLVDDENAPGNAYLFTGLQVCQYAEQAVAPLLAEIERLKSMPFAREYEGSIGDGE